MTKVVKRRWRGEVAGQTKAERRPCDYEAYIPDRLANRQFVLDGDVAARVAEAEAAITKLDVQAAALLDTEALARMLLRAEAVASSRIEGLEVGARRLLRADAARGVGDGLSDVTSFEVLGNIDAMLFAVESVGEGDPITEDLLLAIHEKLLAGTRLEEHAGHFREVQNWIGGSSYNPCSAAYVPPPPELVKKLMADLCAFCNDEDLPAVAQAALAHAQFETIHPFVDGNGRAGRALIHLVLRAKGLALHVLPPVSLILATWAKDYITGLQLTRYRGSSTSKAAHEGANKWIAQFATACIRAAADANEFEQRALQIEASWRQRIGSVRKNSATDLLLRALLGAPVITVNSASTLIGRTYPATNNAVTQLVHAGVLKQTNLGRRNRAYEAPEIITAFTDLERQLASPGGDTHASKPNRRVPARS